jgi:hypothetical protein
MVCSAVPFWAGRGLNHRHLAETTDLYQPEMSQKALRAAFQNGTKPVLPGRFSTGRKAKVQRIKMRHYDRKITYLFFNNI